VPIAALLQLAPLTVVCVNKCSDSERKVDKLFAPRSQLAANVEEVAAHLVQGVYRELAQWRRRLGSHGYLPLPINL
jgi:hypothetical protein